MIEKNMINFFDSIGGIMICIAFICFIVPIIVIIFKNKNLKNTKGILNRDSIIVNSNIYFRVWTILLLTFFFAVGLITIYLALNTTNVVYNKVVGTIFGSTVSLISVTMTIYILKEYIKVLTSQYVIVIDELSDKYYYSDRPRGGDDIDQSGYQLYFKDYYKKYNSFITIPDIKIGEKYNIGDKFYLVFIKGNKRPYVFSTNDFTLDSSEKDKLKNLNDASNYINLKEFVLANNTPKEKVIINKNKIKKDFNRTGHVKTVIAYILICLFLIILSILSAIYFKNLTGTIITLIILVLFGTLAIIKTVYVLKINNNIVNGRINIKEDEVISLNNLIEYRDSNSMISFKFKNYPKIVFENKSEYYDTKIGDQFYLVFVKGEKEPIKVYNKKDCSLDNELKID